MRGRSSGKTGPPVHGLHPGRRGLLLGPRPGSPGWIQLVYRLGVSGRGVESNDESIKRISRPKWPNLSMVGFVRRGAP